MSVFNYLLIIPYNTRNSWPIAVLTANCASMYEEL